MQRSPQPVKFSSQPDLSSERESQEQECTRNVSTRYNIRKKNPDEQQMEDLKEDLLKAFQKMMTTEIAIIKEQNSKILESNAEIKSQLELNAANYEKICNRVTIIEKKHEVAMERINQLEAQLDVLQKQFLKNTVEVRNIPYDDKEDVHNIVVNIYKTLEIPQIKDNATIFRRGRNNGPIVIEYQDSKSKETLLKAARKYNSDNKDKPLGTDILGFAEVSSRIYISEPLTSLTKKILTAARELVKNGSFKYCWASRGNILLRKQEGQAAIVVKSLSQIMDLTSE
uniref:FP protein C-terminal domain-containing protein n=1 Tax=Heliothis virescens TaxID=7102 RepID=A0A2A4K9X3_HELVI